MKNAKLTFLSHESLWNTLLVQHNAFYNKRYNTRYINSLPCIFRVYLQFCYFHTLFVASYFFLAQQRCLVASAPHRDWVGGEKLSPERGGSCSGVRRFAI